MSTWTRYEICGLREVLHRTIEVFTGQWRAILRRSLAKNTEEPQEHYVVTGLPLENYKRVAIAFYDSPDRPTCLRNRFADARNTDLKVNRCVSAVEPVLVGQISFTNIESEGPKEGEIDRHENEVRGEGKEKREPTKKQPAIDGSLSEWTE